MHKLLHVAISAAALLPAVTAQTYPQDLLGLTNSGTAVTLDSFTGVGQGIGPTGFTGHNAMARIGATLYATEQVGSGTAAQYFLDSIDDATGVATRIAALARDLRALAPRSSTTLFGVAQATGSDELVQVNTQNGAITVIGPIGFGSVQGLTKVGGILYGWDLTAGLILVNSQTGVGTDVNPSVGNNGANIQFLTTLRNGSVIGGQNALYDIDVSTGVPDLNGSGQYNDLRGAEERFGVMYTFGTGCGITLNLLGTPTPGSTVTVRSAFHTPGTIGLLNIGFDDRHYMNVPLPLVLDSFLGTVGCTAYAGPEISVGTTASLFGVLSVPIALPNISHGLIFHTQFLTLANVPGGLELSNGGTVRVHL
ncbi:MAG: hypothetical protein JNK15_23570 [Planctomycetes bacterium]|nr:hypothetical protein [Planctomycetota bacterium]